MANFAQNFQAPNGVNTVNNQFNPDLFMAQFSSHLDNNNLNNNNNYNDQYDYYPNNIQHQRYNNSNVPYPNEYDYDYEDNYPNNSYNRYYNKNNIKRKRH